MEKDICIKNNIGIPLEKEGFHFDQPEASDIWSFSRKRGEITQVIRIYLKKFMGENGVKVELETDAPGRPPEKLIWISYGEDEYFEGATKELYKTIMYKGLSRLEKMNAPYKKQTVEMEQYLYENHDEMCREYAAKLQIEENQSPEMIIEAIVNFLKAHSKVEFPDIKRDLIGMAAVYGEMFVKTFSGKWIWHANKECMVMIQGNSVLPLRCLTSALRKGVYDNVLIEYQYIKLVGRA